MQHSSSSGDFFPALDGIRGLAVLSVVIYHTAYFNPESKLQNALFSITKSGYLGVPIFFVLSGFLIALTILRSQSKFSIGSYILRRAAKILPPFILSLVAFSLLALAWKDPENIWLSAAAYLATIPNFSTGWYEINPVYWSLMVEIHFYAVFPALYFAVRKFLSNAELWVAALLFITATCFRLAYNLPESAEYGPWINNAQVFPRALDNFSLGIVFAHIVQNKERYTGLLERSNGIAACGLLLLAATYGACSFANHYFDPFQLRQGPGRVWMFEMFRILPATATFLILFCIFSDSKFWINRLLTWFPLQYAGLISYEWFLFHQPPTQHIAFLTGDAGGSLAVYLLKTLVPFVVMFLVAALVYHFFSAPILRHAKNLQNRSARV